MGGMGGFEPPEPTIKLWDQNERLDIHLNQFQHQFGRKPCCVASANYPSLPNSWRDYFRMRLWNPDRAGKFGPIKRRLSPRNWLIIRRREVYRTGIGMGSRCVRPTRSRRVSLPGMPDRIHSRTQSRQRLDKRNTTVGKSKDQRNSKRDGCERGLTVGSTHP